MRGGAVSALHETAAAALQGAKQESGGGSLRHRDNFPGDRGSPNWTGPMEILEQLERTQAATLKYYDLADDDLAKHYGPGKWSVRYILHHLADSESVLFYRIRRVISEPKQVIWVYDQDAWARKLDYSAIPLELAKSIYASSREGIKYYTRLHYDNAHAIEFVHSETGIRTLKDEFDKVASHNVQHLGDIEKALGHASGGRPRKVQ
jgi:DinB family protein